VSVERQDISPVWTRSFPVSKDPKSIGEHLRKRRFGLGIRQSEAAQRLGVSKRTLSLWETDNIYPTWAYQPRLAEYLGYDPFTNLALGSPKGNETPFVAVLVPTGPLTLVQRIIPQRLKLRKNRKQCAKDLGVSVKTLWGWETGRWEPSPGNLKRVSEFLGIDPNRKDLTVKPA